jgi:hypothetical protein
MASTFAELFSDFRESVISYTEKLDITERAFMRSYTRGMQNFQREVELVDGFSTLNRDIVDDVFYAPDDMLRMVALKDSSDKTILLQGHTQFQRDVELYPLGHQEAPAAYSQRLDRQPIELTFSTADGIRTNVTKTARIATIWQNVITIYPDLDDLTLSLWYVPDIQAFSKNSSQWADFFLTEVAFDTEFQTASLTQRLAPYENTFLNYAIADYIRSKGSANYKVFEDWYLKDVERAKINKPTYNKGMTRSYFLSPVNH